MPVSQLMVSFPARKQPSYSSAPVSQVSVSSRARKQPSGINIIWSTIGTISFVIAHPKQSLLTLFSHGFEPNLGDRASGGCFALARSDLPGNKNRMINSADAASEVHSDRA